MHFTWLGAGVLKDGVLDTVDIVKDIRAELTRKLLSWEKVPAMGDLVNP